MASVLVILFVAILGALFLLWGYRIFLVLLPIWGFFGGFWFGAAGVSLFLGQGFLATATGWLVGFILGLIGALVSYSFTTWQCDWLARAIVGVVYQRRASREFTFERDDYLEAWG